MCVCVCVCAACVCVHACVCEGRGGDERGVIIVEYTSLGLEIILIPCPTIQLPHTVVINSVTAHDVSTSQM